MRTRPTISRLASNLRRHAQPKANVEPGTGVSLPFAVDPPLAAYLYNAYVSGLPHSRRVPAPILDRTIILAWRRSENRSAAFLSFAPRLTLDRCEKLGLIGLSDQENVPTDISGFSRFVSDAIRAGNYVHIFIDYFHIPGNINWRRIHRKHEILIVGERNGGADFQGVYYRNTGGLKVHAIPGEALHAAYSSVFANESSERFQKPAKLAFLVPTGRRFVGSLTEQSLSAHYQAYLRGGQTPPYDGSTQDGKWLREDAATVDESTYGISIYSNLEFFYTGIIRQGSSAIDMRPSRVLYEHKVMLLERHRRGVFRASVDQLDILQRLVNATFGFHMDLLRIKLGTRRACSREISDRISSIRSLETKFLRDWAHG